MAAADVLVHSARSEAWGIVLLEAMAVGTPVLAADAIGPAEMQRRLGSQEDLFELFVNGSSDDLRQRLVRRAAGTRPEVSDFLDHIAPSPSVEPSISGKRVRRSSRRWRHDARPVRLQQRRHLDQLLALLPAPADVEVVFATFDKPDAVQKVEGYRFHALHWPTNRSVTALARNLVVAFRTLRAERPDTVISSGAAAAVPFFWLGKLFFAARTVFIECVDRIDNPTLTARLVRPVTDEFLTQWDSQLAGFPRRNRVAVSRERLRHRRDPRATFDRLLDAASIVAAEQPATSFKVQSGVGSWPARTGSILTVADYFDAGRCGRACTGRTWSSARRVGHGVRSARRGRLADRRRPSCSSGRTRR